MCSFSLYQLGKEEKNVKEGETAKEEKKEEEKKTECTGLTKDTRVDDKKTAEKKAKETELEKYWKPVKENPADFTGWTYLLQYVEQEVNAIIDELCSVKRGLNASAKSIHPCQPGWIIFAVCDFPVCERKARESASFLTHYHTRPHFDAVKVYSCGKHCEKRINCLYM